MVDNILNSLSKDELVDKISVLQEQIVQLNNELLCEDQAHFEWSGNLGKWQWNVKENKVHFNSRKVESLGYSLQEIPGEIGFEFFTSKIHLDDYEMVMQNMRNHLSGATEAYECEYRIVCKTGEWKWFYDRGIIVKRDINNKPIEIVGIVFDISYQKNAEEELESKNTELLRLNQNKDLMLSIIAHDLRGPLGALDSLFNEVTDVSSIAGKTALLTEIAASNHNLYSLVINLLEWAAFQKGELTLQPNKLSIFDVAQLAVTQLKLIADNKNIQIVKNINPKVKAIFDEKMISTVFRNLISNAIKYTPKNGRIDLFDTVFDEKIEITVVDNGIGINSATIDSLFSISYTKSATGTDGEKGTGLGLVLCKDFVEKNGGSISVNSEEGNGSSFTFSLPLD